MRRILQRSKGLRRKSAQQHRVSFDTAPARTRAKIHYYSRPSRRVSNLGAVRPRSTAGRISAVVGAAVAGTAIGAMMGSIVNEAGLLNSLPAQNKVGISATGIVGLGLIVIGFFTQSEGMKLLFFALGGGLVIEEVTRQIDMRFYDFRVAFAGAPALNYEQGISGAQLQLSQMTQPREALPPAAPGQAQAQGTLARNQPTPHTRERHDVPPAAGPGEEFPNRPATHPRVPRGQGASVANRDNWQRPAESRDDQDFGRGVVATRGLDPSAMYRYAIRTAGLNETDPSAKFRYSLRVA